MEQHNPAAFNNVPAQWNKYWSRDMDKLLTQFTEEQLTDIILESQINPSFRKYVVRGQGPVDMADSIQTCLVEHGQYKPKVGAFNDDEVAPSELALDDLGDL
jgi:hypothetical protein